MLQRVLFVLSLVFLFSVKALAQEAPPGLEAAWAAAEPAARIEMLQKFLQEQPEAPQAEAARLELTRTFAYLGETKLAEKNIEAALQHFKQAVAAFPRQVDDKFFEEVAIKLPFAVSVRGYRVEAILLARQLEARFATEPKRLNALGEFYLSLEAPAEALRALHTAARLAPDNARIYRTLGAAYRVNLNLEEAATQYQRAIKADPKDARAYFELGNLHRARGNYELAINLYNHQLSLEPEHAPSLKALALCHLAQDKEPQANEFLAQAVRLTKTEIKQDFYFQTQLAMTYLARNKVGKARLAADAALVAEPRFSWARIAAAEVDLAEGKYFEAERNTIAALKYADFPTLHFLLGKIYLAVEDFEGALVELNKAFSFKAEKFQTRLGGTVETNAATVAELLAPERQAALFQAEPITNDIEFKLVENLVRFEDALHSARQSSSALLSAILLKQQANKNAAASLQKAAEEFVETEGSRKPFRWLYTAERLTQAGQALETVLQLTAEALDVAETITAPEGSLRDYPNYDREGRLRVFRGRTLTLRGRALLKLGRTQDAIATLNQALTNYDSLPERKRAQWQLAQAKESAGNTKEALDLYMVAYEPSEQTAIGADLNRAVIESLYRKVHGSLEGLNERIGKARETESLALSVPKPLAPQPTTTSPEPAAEKTAEKPAEKPVEKAAEKSIEPPPATATTTETTIAKAEPVAEKPATETPTAQPAATAANPAPIMALPTARALAAVIGELTNSALPQELAISEEDAAPPVAATTAAIVTLPDSKVLTAVLSPLTPVAFVPDFALTIEDAPPLSTTTIPSAVAAAIAKAAAESHAATVAAPLALPAAPGVPQIVLPVLEEQTERLSALAVSWPESDDPAPIVATSAPPVAKAPANEKADPAAPQQPRLSDSRVAEIERAINGVVSGGKKGNSAAAIEEAASGHTEGDAPVRVGKPLDPVLPSGESGHISSTTPKVNEGNEQGASRGLPVEVEQRAKTMGQSAGQLSAGAAMEIEVPEKSAGGRKGRPNDEAAPKPAEGARPRRVTDKPAAAPPKENKKPDTPPDKP